MSEPSLAPSASAPAPNPAAAPAPGSAAGRLASIDAVRGVVMVLMVVDHARDYFHAYSQRFDPADLAHTTPAIFFTRFVTHFCAPGFVFLAGAAIRLMREKRSGPELTRFLALRGLILVALELTVVRFGWDFTLRPYFYAQIIWTLGLCTLAMSGFARLSARASVALAAALALLGAAFAVLRPASPLVTVLWGKGVVELPGEEAFFVVGYPVLRWFAVMVAGYWAGALWLGPAERRRRWLRFAGAGAIALFVALRLLQLGDRPWHPQGDPAMSVVAFLNCTKVPVSLPFCLMTLGPLFLALSFFDRPRPLAPFLTTLGRAPLVFYVAHLYLLHALAVLVAAARGQDFRLALPLTPFFPPPPEVTLGFGLPATYLATALAVALLHPLCRTWWRQKSRYGWMRYL